MKHQGLSVVVLVLFNFANQNDVITPVVLTHFPAGELSDGSAQNRDPSHTLLEVDAGELVGHGSGKLPRQVVLFRLQHIDHEVRNRQEILKAGSLAGKAPEN